jgi:hypothetical protein
MAPAAKDIAIDIINGLVFDRNLKPIAEDIVDITTAIDHRTITCLLLFHLLSFLQLMLILQEN